MGKWHLGLGDADRTDYAKPLRPGPLDVGFDHYFGIPASLDMPPYVFLRDGGVVEPPTATIGDSERRRRGTSDRTACLTDLLATVAEVVDADLPDDAGEDSISLLPALRGLDPSARVPVVHHSGMGMFAIRQGPWKLALGLGSGGFSQPKQDEPKPGGPEGQLYNLADDPAETRNRYQDHPEVVARLTSILVRYRASGRSRPAASRSEDRARD